MRTVVAHTADLEPALLKRLHGFLLGVFSPHYSEHTWDHALGGMHVLVLDEDAIAGHGCVVARRIRYRERWLRAGYVESVAVAPDRRRRGVGATVMAEVERLIRGGYRIGALAASEDGMGLYESRGWRRWRGPLSVLAPTGVEALPDEDSVYALEVDVPLDADEAMTCDWREGQAW